MITTSFSLLAGSAVALVLSLAPGEGPKDPITLDEMRAQATERFAKMDTNDDGYVSEDDKPDRFAMADGDASGTITLDEMTAGALAQFDVRDVNGNGTIDDDERGDRGKGRGGRRGEMTRDGLEDMIATRFDRLDKDGNGELTEEEFAAAKDGRRGSGRGQRGEGRGPDMASVDANGDGRISLEEHLAKTEERFAKLDANNDGTLTEEERKAGKKARRGE